MLTTTKELRSRARLAAIAQHFAAQQRQAAANTPDALIERVFSEPQKALIELDREIVRQDGLRGFIEIGWPTVERKGTYRSNWHIDAICEHLIAVSTGEIKRLIINIPPRHMKPVADTAWVLTKVRGRVQLRDVVVGDLILTHKGRFRKVLAVHDNGVLPTVAVRTWNGREAVMAPDHPVLTAEGWKPAGRITERDAVAVVMPDKPLLLESVLSLSTMPPQRCLCLTVEEDHSFTANDIAVHNSLSTSVFWPAFDWIDNPWRQFLFASYAQDLSTRDSVRSRRVIQSPWYQDRWGDRFKISSDQNLKTRYDNDRGGQRMSTSVDAKVTGYGGDFVVADDPHLSKQAESPAKRENVLSWWDETMSSRLNDAKSGAFVIIMQRLNARDLVGHVMSSQSGDYTVLCTPARYEPDHPYHYFKDPRTVPGQLLWPEHMPERELDKLAFAMGPYAAAGQLQQRPTAREGGYFKHHFFSRTRTAAADTKWVRSWDLAASEAKMVKSDPDYTASVKVGYSASRGKWIIGHAEHLREGPGEVRRRMLARAKEDRFQHGYHRIVFPQDPGQAGKDQAQSLGRMLAGFTFECRPVTGGKVERATPAVAQSEMGNVEILDDGTTEANGWIMVFMEELCAFPTGAHDDLVDAFTSGFNALTSGTTGIIDYVDELLRDRRDSAEAAIATTYRVTKESTGDMARALSLSANHAPEQETGGHLWAALQWITKTGALATQARLCAEFDQTGETIWRDLMTSGFIRRDNSGVLVLTFDGELELRKKDPAVQE